MSKLVGIERAFGLSGFVIVVHVHVVAERLVEGLGILSIFDCEPVIAGSITSVASDAKSPLRTPFG